MEPTVTEGIPLYFNWSFWAVVVAALAVVLSQLPPIRMWLKRPRLDVEVHSRIVLTHKVGNPNAQLHLIVSNSGGRTFRLKSIALDFSRDRKSAFTLPIQNYFQLPTDKDAVLFTPVLMRPDDEWSHVANFLHFFDRADERIYREAESKLRRNIIEKRQVLPDTLVEADQQYVRPLMEFFEGKFRWLPGEYEMTVRVETDRARASRKYLFTIFESESAELRAITEGYRFGAGIYWNPDGAPTATIGVQLNEPEV